VNPDAPVVAALGVFDGVHRGHRAVLRAALAQAKAIRGTAVAVTFWPHPQSEASVYSLSHRVALLKEAGIAHVHVLRFTRAFSVLSPERFIRRVLVRRLKVSVVCVGEDFRFGASGRGTVRTLEREGRRLGFRVRSVPIVSRQGTRISSTRIRALISRGALSAARALLGRPVSVLGTVIKGDTVGRTLGFPTANLDPHHEVVPPDGIYAVWVRRGARRYRGACYIGTRPTLAGSSGRRRIEVYLLAFRGRLYGEDIEVQFIRKLRNDRTFSGRDSLRAQISKDVSRCRIALR
jgi:riboflavin kinase / FMN adenylyltransferase